MREDQGGEDPTADQRALAALSGKSADVRAANGLHVSANGRANGRSRRACPRYTDSCVMTRDRHITLRRNYQLPCCTTLVCCALTARVSVQNHYAFRHVLCNCLLESRSAVTLRVRCAPGSVELAQVDTANEGNYEAPAQPQPQNPNPTANPDPVPASRRRSMQSLADIVAASQRAERSGLPAGGSGARGMSLPFTPLCLTFRELSYYVALPKARHALVKNGHCIDTEALLVSSAWWRWRQAGLPDPVITPLCPTY